MYYYIALFERQDRVNFDEKLWTMFVRSYLFILSFSQLTAFHVTLIRLSYRSQIILYPFESNTCYTLMQVRLSIRLIRVIEICVKENCFCVCYLLGCTWNILSTVWSNQMRESEQSAWNSPRLDINSRLLVAQEKIRLRSAERFTNNVSRNFLHGTTDECGGEREMKSIGLVGSWQGRFSWVTRIREENSTHREAEFSLCCCICV